MSWQVSEIFRSIQGEGIRTGRATTFLRLAGCNLRCSWRCDKRGPGGRIIPTYISCDTEHAQNAIHVPRPVPDSQSLAQWLGSIVKPMDDIVVTGGEPTMQSIDSFLEDNDLRRILTNHHCTLETNGTAAVKVPWAKLLSISPKVTADGTDGRMMAMWASETAQLITENPGSQVQLKFVLGNVGDIDIITSFLQDVYNQMSYASNSEILVMLMPVSVNPSYFDQLSRDIVDNIVLQNSGIDFRLCDRLHYRLWKGEQGK